MNVSRCNSASYEWAEAELNRRHTDFQSNGAPALLGAKTRLTALALPKTRFYFVMG